MHILDDVFIYKVALPGNVKGVTILKDGDYIVFINCQLCEETQRKALRHELSHIKNNHLYTDLINVNMCEIAAEQ